MSGPRILSPEQQADARLIGRAKVGIDEYREGRGIFHWSAGPYWPKYLRQVAHRMEKLIPALLRMAEFLDANPLTDDGAAAPPVVPHAQPAPSGEDSTAERATTTAAPSSPHLDEEYSDLEYATRLDGSVMPAPNVLPGEQCWCGGGVGAREPGDHLGLGCLADITHNWTAASLESQQLIEAEQAPPVTPYDCRNCEDSDPGSLHAFDEHCAADKCEPGCEFFAPHPSHPCGKAVSRVLH